MTAEAKGGFDYYLKDWSPKIQVIPDLIPGVGMFTVLDRSRREQGQSIKDFLRDYLRALLNPRQLLTIGTADWPMSNDLGAALRGCAMGARNMTFAGYHTFSPLWIPDVIRITSSLVEVASEHLPKLPIG